MEIQHLTATQIELEATRVGEDGCVQIVTHKDPSTWGAFSIYLRKPEGACWIADVSGDEYPLAVSITSLLNLKLHIPVVNKVAGHRN